MIDLLAGNALVVLAMATALWGYSVLRRDASIVDPWWSVFFLVLTVRSAWGLELTPGRVLLLAAVALWSVRLWAHLLWRSRGKPEDPRYAAFRARYGPERYWWVSFFQVFLLQGALALVISAPLQLAARAPAPDGIALSDVVGAVLFVVGFGFEAVADAQLAAFRDDPTRKGTVLDTGLWRWSRHPNYFGEAVLWWGFGCFALDVPFGWAALYAPAVMTWLLVRVSGVTLLDAHLLSTRPGYARYLAETPAFVPGPRRRAPP